MNIGYIRNEWKKDEKKSAHTLTHSQIQNQSQQTKQTKQSQHHLQKSICSKFFRRDAVLKWVFIKYNTHSHNIHYVVPLLCIIKIGHAGYALWLWLWLLLLLELRLRFRLTFTFYNKFMCIVLYKYTILHTNHMEMSYLQGFIFCFFFFFSFFSLLFHIRHVYRFDQAVHKITNSVT